MSTRKLKAITEALCGHTFSASPISRCQCGTQSAVAQLLSEVMWQRCSVHLSRNAPDYLSRKADDHCRQALRWLDDRRDLREAQQDLHAWLQR